MALRLQWDTGKGEEQYLCTTKAHANGLAVLHVHEDAPLTVPLPLHGWEEREDKAVAP